MGCQATWPQERCGGGGCATAATAAAAAAAAHEADRPSRSRRVISSLHISSSCFFSPSLAWGRDECGQGAEGGQSRSARGKVGVHRRRRRRRRQPSPLGSTPAPPPHLHLALQAGDGGLVALLGLEEPGVLPLVLAQRALILLQPHLRCLVAAGVGMVGVARGVAQWLSWGWSGGAAACGRRPSARHVPASSGSSTPITAALPCCPHAAAAPPAPPPPPPCAAPPAARARGPAGQRSRRADNA